MLNIPESLKSWSKAQNIEIKLIDPIESNSKEVFDSSGTAIFDQLEKNMKDKPPCSPETFLWHT